MNDFELMLDKCEEAIREKYKDRPVPWWNRIKEAATSRYILEHFPKMEKVDSSNIDRIGYDSVNRIVYVLFLNRSMYMYMAVPEAEFQNMKNADSVGSYFCRNFRSKYESKKCTKIGFMGF